jgi:hypothetical protein
MHSNQIARPDANVGALSPRSLYRERARLRGKLSLLAFSCILALAAAEIGVRLFAGITHRIPLIVSDPRTGWALPPNLRDVLKVGDGGQFATSTDEEGHRLTRSAGERCGDSCPNLILVGDSFAQGQGVADSESFAWILANKSNLNIINLGVLGFAPDQELISLQDYLDAHPTLPVRDVVVLVCDNDFDEIQVSQHYLARSKPLFRLVGGQLDQGSYHLSFSDRLMDWSYVYWLINSKCALVFGKGFPDSVAGVDLVVACISAMRELTEKRGARFHVFAHHFLQKQQPFSENLWGQFLERINAQDLTPRLRASQDRGLLGYDGGHWGPVGHQLVAEIVKEHLEGKTGQSGARSNLSAKPF